MDLVTAIKIISQFGFIQDTEYYVFIKGTIIWIVILYMHTLQLLFVEQHSAKR